jgi:hypothetical protein
MQPEVRTLVSAVFRIVSFYLLLVYSGDVLTRSNTQRLLTLAHGNTRVRRINTKLSLCY